MSKTAAGLMLDVIQLRTLPGPEATRKLPAPPNFELSVAVTWLTVTVFSADWSPVYVTDHFVLAGPHRGNVRALCCS